MNEAGISICLSDMRQSATKAVDHRTTVSGVLACFIIFQIADIWKVVDDDIKLVGVQREVMLVVRRPERPREAATGEHGIL
jgi:hypothetical protein